MLTKVWVGLLGVAAVVGLDSIEVKGTKFFKSTGEQFIIKGVGWQPRDGGMKFLDPLANPANCKRDIANFKELGLNMVRVYQIDQDKNHDDCMKQLEDAGIYLALDLPVPKYSINRENPNYNLEILNHFKQTVDMFDKYNNVGLYFAGNEVNNDKTNTNANPFVKAVLRDIKAYIQTKTHKIPVGYANNDDDDIRKNISDYFNCGTKEERGDFYSVNVYRWCGDVTFKSSGYGPLIKELNNYSVPVFLSEYGCIEGGTRMYKKEIQSIYGPDMNEVFQGGILYEYSYEDNKYGIVDIDPSSQKVTKRSPDYQNFKEGLAAVKLNPIQKKSYSPPSDKAATCPEVSSNWKSSSKLPLTPSAKACECMVKRLECKASKKVSSLSGKEVEELFNYLCAHGADCPKYLSVDGEKGVYGAFSGCLPSQQLSWALNAAYLKSGKQPDACKDTGVLQNKADGKVDECIGIKTDISESGSESEDEPKLESKDSKDSKDGTAKNSSAVSTSVSALALGALTLLNLLL